MAMTTLRLALIQMSSEVDSRDKNVAKAMEYVDEVAAEKPDLIVLPEFFNTEYFPFFRGYPGYLEYAESDTGHTITSVREKAIEHNVAICATILEEEGPGLYYDTSVLVDSTGDIAGKYRKTHPGGTRSLEKMYFRGGTDFPVWNIKGFRVSAVTCYDNFFPETGRCAALGGAELIIAPFAAPAESFWEPLMQIRAFENGVYVAPCNKVGPEGDYRFGGASMVVDPFGEVLARAGSDEDETLVVEIDRDRVFAARKRYPMARDRRPEIYGAISSTDSFVRGMRV